MNTTELRSRCPLFWRKREALGNEVVSLLLHPMTTVSYFHFLSCDIRMPHFWLRDNESVRGLGSTEEKLKRVIEKKIGVEKVFFAELTEISPVLMFHFLLQFRVD